MINAFKQNQLPEYNTMVNNEDENIYVQQMYRKLGYNKQTALLTSKHMQDSNYGKDYQVGAVYAGKTGYISVDDVENVQNNFEHTKELTIEDLEKMVREHANILERNDESDATHHADGISYVKVEGVWYVYDYDGNWVKSKNDDDWLVEHLGSPNESESYLLIEYSQFLNTKTDEVQTLPSHAGDDKSSGLYKLLGGVQVITRADNTYLGWDMKGGVYNVATEVLWREQLTTLETYVSVFKTSKVIFDIREQTDERFVTVTEQDPRIKWFEKWLKGEKVEVVFDDGSYRTLHNKVSLDVFKNPTVTFRSKPELVEIDGLSLTKEQAIQHIERNY